MAARRLATSLGGQKVVREDAAGWIVKCAKCKGEVNVDENAWFDTYRGKVGKYVHYDCLSDKRKAEMNDIEE